MKNNQREVEYGMNLLEFEYSLGLSWSRSIISGSSIQLFSAFLMQLWMSFSSSPSRFSPFQLGIISRLPLLTLPSSELRLLEKVGLSRACETRRRTRFCASIHSCDLRSVQLMSFMVKLLQLLQNLSEVWQLSSSPHSRRRVSRLPRKPRLYSSSLRVKSSFSAWICFWNYFMSSSISSSSCMRRLSSRLSSYSASSAPFSRLNFMSSASRLPMVRSYSSSTDFVCVRMAVVSHSTPSLSGFTAPSWGCWPRHLASLKQRLQRKVFCWQDSSVQMCVAFYLRCSRQVTARGRNGFSSI